MGATRESWRLLGGNFDEVVMLRACFAIRPALKESLNASLSPTKFDTGCFFHNLILNLEQMKNSLYWRE